MYIFECENPFGRDSIPLEYTFDYYIPIFRKKSKMEDLFDQFKIQLLSRHDIMARFSVANNSIVEQNWPLVLATLTFYSIGLAETASNEEGFFTYLHQDTLQRKDLPSACRDFMTDRSVTFVDTTPVNDSNSDEDFENLDGNLEEDEFYSPSADAIWPDFYVESFMTAHNITAPLYRPEDATVELYSVRHNPPKAWPVGSYKEISHSGQAIGYSCQAKVGHVRPFVHNMANCASRLAEITEIIGKRKEVAGNWGDYIQWGSIIPQPGTSTTKTITLNLDRFKVRLQKNSEDIFEARFTPISELHHAASMMARKCVVKWDETKLNPISILNKVILRIIERTPETITIETEYMALDCL